MTAEIRENRLYSCRWRFILFILCMFLLNGFLIKEFMGDTINVSDLILLVSERRLPTCVDPNFVLISEEK